MLRYRYLVRAFVTWFLESTRDWCTPVPRKSLPTVQHAVRVDVPGWIRRHVGEVAIHFLAQRVEVPILDLDLVRAVIDTAASEACRSVRTRTASVHIYTLNVRWALLLFVGQRPPRNRRAGEAARDCDKSDRENPRASVSACPRRMVGSVIPPRSSIASSTLGGDSGRSSMRNPSWSRTAFDSAANGATMGVSPTPRTP